MNLASDFYWTGNETVLALHGIATLLVALCCVLGIVLLLLSARKRRLGSLERFLLIWTALFVVVFGPTDNLIRYGMMIYWSAFAAASLGLARNFTGKKRIVTAYGAQRQDRRGTRTRLTDSMNTVLYSRKTSGTGAGPAVNCCILPLQNIYSMDRIVAGSFEFIYLQPPEKPSSPGFRMQTRFVWVDVRLAKCGAS